MRPSIARRPFHLGAFWSLFPSADLAQSGTRRRLSLDARRGAPFHAAPRISAAGVRPVSKAGTRPVGSSSGSPGSRSKVSWKGLRASKFNLNRFCSKLDEAEALVRPSRRVEEVLSKRAGLTHASAPLVGLRLARGRGLGLLLADVAPQVERDLPSGLVPEARRGGPAPRRAMAGKMLSANMLSTMTTA